MTTFDKYNGLSKAEFFERVAKQAKERYADSIRYMLNHGYTPEQAGCNTMSDVIFFDIFNFEHAEKGNIPNPLGWGGADDEAPGCLLYEAYASDANLWQPLAKRIVTEIQG